MVSWRLQQFIEMLYEVYVMFLRTTGEAHHHTVKRPAAPQAQTPVVPSAALEHPAVAGIVRTPSRQISAEMRQRAEGSLGADFSAVQIHEGPLVAQAAGLLGASAFTIGNHVALGRGRRDDLLAHELVHVAQQANARSIEAKLDHGTADPWEQEASLVGPAVVRGHSFTPLGLNTSVPAIQRAITPEDVAIEMVGKFFNLAAPFSDGSVTMNKGDQVVALNWDNAATDVTVQGGMAINGATVPVITNVPKTLLRPAAPSGTTLHAYKAGVSKQSGSVTKGEAELAAWESKRDAYKGPKAAALWEAEKRRLEGLLARRRMMLNRRLIQETMFNRFDPIIETEVNAANSVAGLSGKNALSPNLVKSMLFQESQLGTAGYHLEEPPSHPVKSRFNLGQVIDSSGLALLTLMEREQPSLIATFNLASLRSELTSAQAEKSLLETKRGAGNLTPTEVTRLSELISFSAQSWEAFIWSYRASGNAVGFADAVDALFAATTPARNLDYTFWIHMAVLWLFEKKRPGMSWTDAIRAYNGSGARAQHYRDAVLSRANAAAKGNYVPSGI